MRLINGFLAWRWFGRKRPKPIIPTQVLVPAELLSSFDRGYENLRLIEFLPAETNYELRNYVLHVAATSYTMGMADGRNRS